MPASPETIKSIEKWLKSPADITPLDDIEVLNTHLAALADNPAPTVVQFQLLDGLHARALSTIESTLPRLYTVRLPISHNTRRSVRAMQEALEALIRMGLNLVEAPDANLVKGLGTPPELSLWRIFHAASRHLLLSDLTTSPHVPGIWFNVHRTYLAARRHRVERSVPFGAQYDLQSLYVRILLLGALPSSAVSAQERGYAYRLILKLAAPLQLFDTQPQEGLSSLLWVAPDKDGPPVHFERKAPQDGALALFVQYRSLLDELSRMLNAVEKHTPPPGLLPDDISPRTAQITLSRLIEYLEAPKKRRFPRRRQGYRANLCFGFDGIIQLLSTEAGEPSEFSEWMIVNESPGGYAAMHVAGRPQKVQVGDLIGMRREGEAHWSICIVRWAISENQEHIELGLNEISPRTRLGHVATAGEAAGLSRNPALLFPALPPLRTSDAMAFSPETRPANNKKHTLVLAGEKADIREFVLGEILEQSSDVEIFTIPGHIKT